MDGIFANPLHWGILLVIVLIIFGPGKLPNVGSALGQSLREFKKASRDEEPVHSSALLTSSTATTLASPVPPADAPACAACGSLNLQGARFCSNCAAAMPAAADAAAAPSASTVAGPLSCAFCQTENPPTNQFCAHCGRLLEAAMEHV